MYKLLVLTVVAICVPSSLLAQTTRPVEGVDRAIIISVDGLRPDLLISTKTPHIRSLIATGSYSFWARTTAVSVTIPSHVSMLTGVIPARHGLEWNRDLDLRAPVYAKVPTLFELAKRAGYTTALAAGKSKFDALAKPGTLDWQFVTSSKTTSDAEVALEAIRIVKANRPQVMVVHFPNVDNVGHAKGWGSPEQLEALEKADDCLGLVLDAMRDVGIAESALVILTADHGGQGRTHGADDARSRHIPWIAVGPGIRRNYDLTRQAALTINTEDTFATTCHFMGIPIDGDIDGKPVLDVLKERELMTDSANQ